MGDDSPLLLLVLARLRDFWRQKGVATWLFGFPLVLTLALGLAFRIQERPASVVGVLSGPGAEAYAGTLDAHPEIVARRMTPEEATIGFRNGSVALVVEPTADGVSYQWDPTRPDSVPARALVGSLLQQAAGRRDVVDARDEIYDAPGGRYIDWFVPGLLALQLMTGSVFGFGYSLAHARQSNFLKRLSVTPMRRRDYLLSLMVARLVLVPLEATVLLVFARLVLDVKLHGSVAAVLVMTLLGAAPFCSLGLVIGSRARTAEAAGSLINIVFMPMLLFSGVFFSATRFPDAIQPWLRLLPLAAVVDALRRIINEGASLTMLASPIAVVIVWSVAGFFAALRLFRWS